MRIPPSERARLDTFMRRAMPGGARGGSDLVGPPPTIPQTSVVPVPHYLSFTFGSATTPVAVSESGDYELRIGGPLGIWIAKLKTAGSSTTTVVVKKNGSTIGTFSLTSGLKRVTLDLTGTSGSPFDDIAVAATAAGTGALGLVVLAPIR